MDLLDSFIQVFLSNPSVSAKYVEKEISSTQGFLTSVSTYLGRPNLVNSNCFGASVGQLLIESIENQEEIHNHLLQILSHSFAGQLGYLEEKKVKALTIHRELIVKDEDEVKRDVAYVEIWDFDSMRIKMIPKSILEKGSKAPINKLLPPIALIFEYQERKMKISAVGDLGQNEASVSFYFGKLFPKLFSWATVEENPNDDSLIPKSSLLSVDLLFYTTKYKELKRKYAAAIKSIWSGSTNSDKFIHEDVAIAAYLISYWAKAGQVPNFVDLGCGNGLLTFFLTAEGFKGFGLDVRKRYIWDKYPLQLDLRVEAINPSLDHQFHCNENTWFIGNHPDELTPWIPILANKTGSSFFIIPCCSFDFNGKFNRGIKGKNFGSQYQCYLHYLKYVSDKSGYSCQFDKLRIPSTKRVCIIGIKKKDFYEKSEELSQSLSTLINEGRERNLLQNCRSKSNKSEEFEPRSSIEEVRNCSRIDRKIVDSIVIRVFNKLLSGNVNLIKDDEYLKEWNAGVELNLQECLELLTPKEKNLLKRQHSGFQTLLRNNGHIFYCNNGKVKIKAPSYNKYLELKKRKGDQWERKNRCFFNFNHPNGCPFSQKFCSYFHTDE